jgi:hypothetical protein
MMRRLAARLGGRLHTVFADGACDGAPVYAAIRAARPAKSPPKIVIPLQPQLIRAAGGRHGGTNTPQRSVGMGAWPGKNATATAAARLARPASAG